MSQSPMPSLMSPAIAAGAALLIMSATIAVPARADETCVSPYSPKIVGQEDFAYVWTLGVPGLGDEQDKLVTVDANPGSATFGQVVSSVSVGGRNEAHHSGYTDDRRYLWAGALDTSKIFVFDVHTNPAKPSLARTIDDFATASGGAVGPHSFFALPGRMMITGLSNNKDHGGRTALVEYSNDGSYVATHWMPTDDNLQGAEKTSSYADGYGYDVRFLPTKNLMVTTSFTGWSNYMMDFGKMLNDAEAMKRFGNTAVVWDLHQRKPLKIFDVPGAPLEIRCAWGNNYCFTATALTSKIWLIYEDRDKGWTAKEVGTIGDPSKVPLPVAFSISADDRYLWVNTFMDGSTRLFDISDPFNAKLLNTFKIGSQVNMVSQSWDGKRVYFSSSLLANWDKKGADDQQFLKMFFWNGKELKPGFEVDFYAQKLGRAHLITLNSRALYQSNVAGGGNPPPRTMLADAAVEPR